MITSTKAIFVEKDDMKTPVAVVGLQFNHRAMYELYNITTKKVNYPTSLPCNSSPLLFTSAWTWTISRAVTPANPTS